VARISFFKGEGLMLISSKLNQSQTEDLYSIFLSLFDECATKSSFEYEFKEFCSDNKLPFSKSEFENAYEFFHNCPDNQK
jgi:hypothetical protein